MMKKEWGISELIGALMLTAVIAAGIGIIAVILISEPPPEKLPAVDFGVIVECPNTAENTINITHKRGDSFRVFDESYSISNISYYLRIDDNTVNIRDINNKTPGDFTLIKYNATGSSNLSFSVGDVLEYHYPGSSIPRQIQFISKSPSGAERLLWSSKDLSITCAVSGTFFADFYADNRNPCVCTPVQFYDISSSDANEWNWGFDSGAPGSHSGKTPPPITYHRPGTYSVRLIANNTLSGASDTEIKEFYINVQPLSAGFDATPSTGYAPMNVRFTDTSSCFTPGTSSWIFDERNTSAIPLTDTGLTSNHVYWDTGVYNVSHTVTDTCGNSQTVYKNITVLCPGIICDLVARYDLSGYAPLAVGFSDNSTSGRPIIWSNFTFDDHGVYHPTDTKTASHTYMEPGVYRPNLVSMNDCRNTGTDTETINVYCPPVNPTYTTDPSPAEGPSSLTIRFNDTTTGYNLRNRTWNFDDGTTSEESSPVHTFYFNESNGCRDRFNVVLSRWNWCSGPFNVTIPVNLTCPEVRTTFTSTPPDGDAPLTVIFDDTTAASCGHNIDRREWDFGDVNSSVGNPRTSTTDPASHIFYDPGVYRVNLTTWNDCGNSDNSTQLITVRCPSVTAEFTPSPHNGDAPLLVNFDDASRSNRPIIGRNWTFGDGNVSIGNDLQPHNLYLRPGTYQVNLTATNDCGNSGNSTQSITVRCPPVIANFTTNPERGDAPLLVNFLDASISNLTIIGRNWTFGDGNVSIGNNLQPHNLYGNPGTYRVNLTATNDCGNDNTTYRNVEVTCPSPVADFITNPTPPEGKSPLTVSFTDNSTGYSITNYSWSFGNGNTSFQRNPPPQTYRTVGLFPANLTLRNWCGNENSITRWVNVTCEEVYASYTANRTSGLIFEFNDTSTGGNISTWRWDFGDGNITQGSTIAYKNLVHAFIHPGTYPVNLTVWNDCGNSDQYESYITAICEPMYADFTWDMPTDTDPYTVQFHSPLQNCGSEDCEYDIRDWEWDFEDGLGNTSGIREPIHTFPDGYNPEGKYVTLTVKNMVDSVCNREASIRKPITFNCPPLSASFTTNISSGPPGSTVAFTDTSTPQADILRWRWIFGDTTQPWESTDPLNHNPPPHTYSDPVPRIYTAVLQIYNSCGQSFSASRIISVTAPASISGHLWEDNNVNGREDSGEPPLQGWKVNLERRDGTNWVFQQSTLTNAAGNYQFNPDVATATYRVTIDYPTGQTWKTTYSYRSNAERISGLLSIGADRTITGVNFGNARWKTSSLIIPGYMARYNQAGTFIDNWYYRGLSDVAEYFEFTTSRDPTVRIVYMNPRNSNSGTFTIPSYSAWGNSSFTFYSREYNTYLKTTYGGQSGAFYLRYWRYNGVDYFGIPFNVPDNTAIAASQLVLKYYWDPVIYFKFDKPLEGEIIPYTNSYRVEVHFQGPNEDTSNCYLTTPVSSAQRLTYNATIAEYARNIDTRTWEGQTVLFTARMYLTTSPRRYEYTYVTATIGWEPITTAISNVQSEATAPQIKGLTTVTGTVTGKWRDNANVTLIVNNKETYPMVLVSQSGATSTFRAQFDPEPYAGKTIPLKIRAYPQTGRGNMAESAIYSATVVSKLPLIANFTADPWTGPVPIWISFTDTSQGGPNWWSWDFKDGNTSSVQNPIKSYTTPGNYSVTLQVRNITGVTRTVSKWVNLTGSWHKVEVNSNRFSYLKSGGELWWIATVDDSSITVNNTAYPVMSDDKVKLVLRSDINNTQNNRIELGGGITTCNLSNVSLFLNGNLMDNGASTAINMLDFHNFHTNLQLVALKDSSKFALIKWDTDDWKTISKTRDLNVYDLMPDWNKTMTLYLSEGFTTFDGWASDYTPK